MRNRTRATTFLLTVTVALGLLGSTAAAYINTNPTSGPGNPFAHRSWFIDWQWGMAQRQYLAYATDTSWNHVTTERDTLMRLVTRVSAGASYRGVPVRLLGGQLANEFKTHEMYRHLNAAAFDGRLASIMPGHRANDARLMWKLARNPETFRLTDKTPDVYGKAREYLDRIQQQQPGAMGFLYLYGLPHDYADPQRRTGSKCGNMRPPRSGAWHRNWYDRVAAAIGGHPTVVFLEPDGLGTVTCLARRYKSERYRLLSYAAQKLEALPNTTVYMDAGHSRWFKPRKKASMLRRAGVRHARGFFLNSTGYHLTRNEVAYGNKVARMVGGKHFVVSTAINGNGPYKVRRKRYAAEQRCNPPGRALGPEPSVQTSSRYADAYFWIGRPGLSGGRCPHRGQPIGPGGGKWWEWFALRLAERARWQ